MLMLNLPEDFELTVEAFEQALPEAAARFDAIKSLEKDVINTVVENMSTDEPVIALGILSLSEGIQLDEVIKRHVNSLGDITRRKDRKTRERLAFQTTGLTKSRRRQIARRAVKTKRANPSIQVRAQRKTKKALRKRAALGIS